MAARQEYVDYVAEQLQDAGRIRTKRMFGEYGLYCDDVFFAVICDDQLFVKATPQGEKAFPEEVDKRQTWIWWIWELQSCTLPLKPAGGLHSGRTEDL